MEEESKFMTGYLRNDGVWENLETISVCGSGWSGFDEGVREAGTRIEMALFQWCMILGGCFDEGELDGVLGNFLNSPGFHRA